MTSGIATSTHMLSERGYDLLPDEQSLLNRPLSFLEAN